MQLCRLFLFRDQQSSRNTDSQSGYCGDDGEIAMEEDGSGGTGTLGCIVFGCFLAAKFASIFVAMLPDVAALYAASAYIVVIKDMCVLRFIKIMADHADAVVKNVLPAVAAPCAADAHIVFIEAVAMLRIVNRDILELGRIAAAGERKFQTVDVGHGDGLAILGWIRLLLDCGAAHADSTVKMGIQTNLGLDGLN